MKVAFLIKDIESDLRRDFKTACAYFDISGRATLMKHMQNIVNDYRKAIMDDKKMILPVKKAGNK